jgi:DNA-binding response OmpR family regulator
MIEAHKVVMEIDGGVLVNFNLRLVYEGLEGIRLTETEAQLLKILLISSELKTHRQLVSLVQGYDVSDRDAPGITRPLVSRLRKKLSQFAGSEDWIINVRGIGYYFQGLDVRYYSVQEAL